MQHDDDRNGGETKKATLDEKDITTRRMGRRASVTIIGAASAALAALGLVTTGHAQDRGGCSDADPTDPYGQGRSCGGAGGHPCSDVDPTDPGGQGRTCHSGGPCSDVDPTDPVAQGRWCPGGGGGASRGGSVTDSDPSDPVGHGRGGGGGGGGSGGSRGCSDSDPYDPVGAGRSCR
jgi:hypothetical protein